MNQFSLYMFFDEENHPFYVGKTNNFKKRKLTHLWEIKRGSNYPNHNKLRKVLASGTNQDDAIKEIFKNIDATHIDALEIGWIKILKNLGYKLKNLTNGGEGSKGFTEEMRRKLSLLRIGQKYSQETKDKMSKARIGCQFTETHKKNLSKSRKKRVTSISTRQKCSKTSTGKINIKIYRCISPQGESFITNEGLTQFCQKHNLTSANMHKVLRGQRDNHKGWRIEYV
jgi:hypothetical protein